MPAAESLPLAAANPIHVTVADLRAAPTPRIAELSRNAAAATRVRVTWWASASRLWAVPSNEGTRLSALRRQSPAGPQGYSWRAQMTATDLHELPGVEEVGEELRDLIRELFPICRSITGNGLRQTFELIGERIPLEVTEVPTGRRCWIGRSRRSERGGGLGRGP